MSERLEAKTGESFEKAPAKDQDATRRALGRLAVTASAQKQGSTSRHLGQTAVTAENATRTARQIGRAAVQSIRKQRNR